MCGALSHNIGHAYEIFVMWVICCVEFEARFNTPGMVLTTQVMVQGEDT